MIANERFFVTAAMALMGYDLYINKALTLSNARGLTYNCGVCHGPLSSAADAVVETALICVVTTIGICEEEGIDATPLQQLRKVDPVVQIALSRGFVGRILQIFRQYHLQQPLAREDHQPSIDLETNDQL